MQDHRSGAPPRQFAKYGGDPGQGVVWQGRRYRLRYLVRKLARWVAAHEDGPPSWDRTARCGVCLGSAVELRCKCSGGVYPCNVETCGNFWACAVCSAKIQTRRGAEVIVGADAWVAQGGSLGMVTLTARHGEWMDLRDVLGAVTGSWRKLRSRKEWRRLRKLIGGTVKALEVTVGENGWHPHLHVLLFIRPGVDVSEVEGLCAELHVPWAGLLRSQLGVAPSVEHGIDFRPLNASAAAYVAKIGYEVASPGTKSGRTVFGLLEDASDGEAEAFFRCIEFFDTMKGRHSLDWSPGLRDRLGLRAEKSDEELAQEDEDGDHVCWVEKAVWDRALHQVDEDGVPCVVGIMRNAEEIVRNREVN